MLTKDMINSKWTRYNDNPLGVSFRFDPPNLQDRCSMALSRMILQMGDIGQNLEARLKHN